MYRPATLPQEVETRTIILESRVASHLGFRLANCELRKQVPEQLLARASILARRQKFANTYAMCPVCHKISHPTIGGVRHQLFEPARKIITFCVLVLDLNASAHRGEATFCCNNKGRSNTCVLMFWINLRMLAGQKTEGHKLWRVTMPSVTEQDAK